MSNKEAVLIIEKHIHKTYAKRPWTFKDHIEWFSYSKWGANEALNVARRCYGDPYDNIQDLASTFDCYSRKNKESAYMFKTAKEAIDEILIILYEREQ